MISSPERISCSARDVSEYPPTVQPARRCLASRSGGGRIAGLGKTMCTDLVNDHDGGVLAKSWLRFWEETGLELGIKRQEVELDSRDSLVGWIDGGKKERGKRARPH